MEEYINEKRIFEMCKNDPPDNIFIFDNVLPENICKSIINEIENTPLVDEKEITPNTNAKCKIMRKNIEDVKYYEYIHKIFVNIGSMMIKKYGVPISGCIKPNFRKIYGNTRIHVDGVEHKRQNFELKRSLSIILALNSDYDGGELVFPVQKRKIKLKMGQVIVFPPYWTHPHYTNDLKNDTFRYTLNTWYHE